MPIEDRHLLDYEKPPARKRRPFLARPFWRDYVLAYFCVGIGVLLVDCGVPARGAERVILLSFAAIVGGAE